MITQDVYETFITVFNPTPAEIAATIVSVATSTGENARDKTLTPSFI